MKSAHDRHRRPLYGKLDFRWKVQQFFYQFLSLSKKICRTFGGDVLVRLSELHFTRTDDHFGWRDTFRKKRIVSISLDSERKIVWLLLTSFLHCWQNFIFCRQSTILNTCSNNFNFFSSIAKFWIRNSTLLAQMFRHSCQKCNLRVQAIIWWELHSPLKNVTVLT